MPSPLVPFVPPILPFAPGIPALFASAGVPPSLALATADGPGILSLFGQEQWGIFDASGNPVLTVDAVASVEYARDYRISDYPQEQGAFESYNKVQVPFQAKVGFLLNQSRVAFLNEIEAQLATLSLVSVVTPEVSYPSANLTHYGYRRVARNGVTMVLVEVWCEEVRVTASTDLTGGGGTAGGATTQSVNGATALQGGTVQAQPTTTTPTNLVTGLPDQTVSPSPPPTSLTTPNVGPAYYTADNLPTVPNFASQLTPQQLSGATAQSQATDAAQAQVTSPDANGNITWSFVGP